MIDLEHLILFGLPENKLEWFDSRTSCRLPFASRTLAEAAFTRFTDTLARWQALDRPLSIARRDGTWRAAAGGIKLELVARVIEASIPIDPEAILQMQDRFWQPSLWRSDMSGQSNGRSGFWQWAEARTNVPIYFMGLTDRRRRGWSSGRVDVLLPEIGIVQPDAFYYGPEREGCLVDGSYFLGAPDLIVEILTPANAAWTLGARREVYALAGVRHFWVAAPQKGALETWTLCGSTYELTGSFLVGERFHHSLFPDHEIDVHELLRSRWAPDYLQADGEENVPEAEVAPDRRIPLQNLLLGGHPDRRYEVLDGRIPCVAAFGSEAAAEQRFREWAIEIAHWDNSAVMGDGTVDSARFDLRREGNRISLDVAADYATYEAILRVYHCGEVWREYNEELDSCRIITT